MVRCSATIIAHCPACDGRFTQNLYWARRVDDERDVYKLDAEIPCPYCAVVTHSMIETVSQDD